MSTYYQYEDVKIMIAHKLMSMDGWKVYGYHADESDMMSDYYSPAYWGGMAEKNGYILCVNINNAEEPTEIRKYNYDGIKLDTSIAEKIAKLERMTVERGASETEEKTAKAAIEKLKEKVKNSNTGSNYIVVGMIPGHMANPPKMNWHIEKDGIIIAKGNGILKYASIDKYYRYGDKYMDDMNLFRQDKMKWSDNWVHDMVWHGYYTDEKARKAVKSRISDMEKDLNLMNDFEQFISKIDTTCGGLLGEGDGTIYEKITVTEYKKENKAIENTEGTIKDGQCFILKANFNYGRFKGLVYRIHSTEYNGKKSYHAHKLNGKLTKECTGQASRNNYWNIGSEDDQRFLKWIEKGAISWCHIEEVKTPYEVEKVVKKTIKHENKTTETMGVNNYTYELTEDIDTRDGSKIYLVKVTEKLSKEEYTKINQYIKSLGGYYSRFKHAFLFKENPSEKIKMA